jgi:hypothetical protein
MFSFLPAELSFLQQKSLLSQVGYSDSVEIDSETFSCLLFPWDRHSLTVGMWSGTPVTISWILLQLRESSFMLSVTC